MFTKLLLINLGIFERLGQPDPLYSFGASTTLINRFSQILTFCSGGYILFDIFKIHIIDLQARLKPPLAKFKKNNQIDKINEFRKNLQKYYKLKMQHPSKIKHSGGFFFFNNTKKIKEWELNNKTETSSWYSEVEIQKKKVTHINLKYLVSLLFCSLIPYYVSSLTSIDFFLCFTAFIIIFLFLDYLFIWLALRVLLLILSPVFLAANFLINHPRLSIFTKLLFFSLGLLGFILSFLTSKG